MILVPLHHTDGTVHKCAFPRRVVSQRHIAVALHISLVHHIQAIMIKKGVHLRIVRIMTGADGIQVMTLIEQHILQHRLHGDGLAIPRMDIMAVSAFEQGQLAIDVHLIVPDGYRAEAILLESGFSYLTFRIQQFQFHRVQVRGLRAPQMRVAYRTAGQN